MNRKKRMTLFFAVYTLFSLGANFAHPVTPTIFNTLGLKSYMFGMALASMLTSNFLFSPFWGKINDFFSSRTSLLIGCAGYAVGQILFGLSQTEAHFIAARMFTGIFTGGAFVSVLTYIVNTSQTELERGRGLAISATIQSLGGAFGYFIGGFLGEIDTYLPVWVQVATLSLSGILFFIIMENDARVSIKEISIKSIANEANPFAAFIASRKFMNIMLFVLFMICVLQNVGFTAFDQTFNYYIKDQLNFTSGVNGAIKGIMGIITLVVNSTVTLWLLNKSDIRKSVIYIFMIIAVNMAGVILIGATIPFMALNIILFGLNAITVPLLQNIVADHANGDIPNRNLIMGFYNSMKSLGGIIGAVFAGLLYSIGPKLPFVGGFVSVVIALVLASMYYARYKKDPIPEE